MIRTVHVALLLLAVAASGARADESEFQPIFDGRTLDGWLGQDMSFWSVEDGAITGTITPEHAPPMNQYLVYQRELVENFELKLDSRITGSTTPNTNGGFQFRSRRTPNGDVAGYQVDNNFGQPWKVRLYDEFGRHDLALEGEHARFDALGKRHVRPLELAAGARDFRLDEWHEYHLIADGQDLSLAINGKLVAVCRDDDPQQFEAAGVLAMQLHTGPPMKAQFRNLRLKRLPRTPPATPRERLFEVAALDWTLGDRPDTHQPPLAVHGKIVAEQPIANACKDQPPAEQRMAQLVEASFDAGNEWNASGPELTVYVRVNLPDGNWAQPLFGKGAADESLQFRLAGKTNGNDTQIEFVIRTDRGLFRAAFPSSELSADRWHDLVGRYDGQALALYVDGHKLAEVAAHGNLVPNQAAMLIGGERAADGQLCTFAGQLQRASLWVSALDEEQIGLISAQDSRPTRE